MPINFMLPVLPIVSLYSWGLSHVEYIHWTGWAPTMSGFFGILVFAGSGEMGSVPRHRTSAVGICLALLLMLEFVLGFALSHSGAAEAFIAHSLAATAVLYAFAAITHLPPRQKRQTT